jgi:hypothetical protein
MSVIQSTQTKTAVAGEEHLNLELTYSLSSVFLEYDSGVDDPVNDTGLGPECGDFQFYKSVDLSTQRD